MSQCSKYCYNNIYNIDSRKESSFNLGSAETKLLYTLHWILLDAAEECILQLADTDGKIDNSPFAYLFPVSAITVALFAWVHRATDSSFSGL